MTDINLDIPAATLRTTDMAIDADMPAAAAAGTATVTFLGGLYAVFNFVSGARADIKSHTEKLAAHDVRFDKIEDALSARLDRLESKMDAQHTQLTAVILGLKEHA